MKRNIRTTPLVLGLAAGLGIAWLARRQRRDITGLSEWRKVLARLYGVQKTEQLAGAVRREYGALTAQTPLPVNKALRGHLTESILPGLALYRVLLREKGGNRQAALAEVDNVFRPRALKRGRILTAPLKLLPNSFALFRMVLPLTMKQYPAEGWDFTHRENSTERVAFDAARCYYLNTLTALGAPELTASFCKCDDVMAEALPPSIRFVRPHTLGRGDAVCDFQYLRGT